jgi:hypothetical protein
MRASAIRHLAAAQRGAWVAAALFRQTVQIWDLNTAEQLSELNTVLDYGGHRLALSPTGQFCVTAAWSKGKRGGIACYDVTTGVEVWHRVDIRHTQRLRFSSTGHTLFCGLEDGRLQNLSVSTGETLDALAGLRDIVDSPHTSQLLWETRSRGFLIRGPLEFRVPRLTFGLLDAVFSPDALCLSEAAGPVRCVDCRTAQERWRYQPPNGTHVLRLGYSKGVFYGVERDYQHAACCTLVRFSEEGGREDQICGLTGWKHEFCLGAEFLITSDGDVVRVADGETIRRLRFPQTDYPDRDR